MLPELFLGLLLGIFLCFLWTQFFRKRVDFIKELEHYHWGLLALIRGAMDYSGERPFFFYGLGLVFLVDELLQKNKFAYGSRHFKESLIVGVLLLIVLVTVYLAR